MEKSEESSKKQWSLFQAFCCGPKATKKRSSPPSQQPECNVLSPRQIVASETIQRNSHNQTSIAMRPTAINEDNQQNNYQLGQDIEEDNGSNLSSSRKLPANHKQKHPISQLQSLPSNHIVNIKTNQLQHHRQSSVQYEPPSLQMLKSLQQQQQFQQQQQLQQLQQQLQQVNGSQSQSFHRRAFSNVNPSSSNLRQASDVIHEVEQSQAYSQQSQRLEESHQSMNSARRQQSQQLQHQQFYTMENQFFKLKTRYAIHEIDFVENRPQDKEFQSYFLFDCPICFRHFNSNKLFFQFEILKSDCCDHYLCHYCLRDIYNKAKDSEKDSFKFRCMFCQLPAPLYIDADCAADKIKRYSDSPFVNTPKEQTAGGIADTVQPFNIHLNNLIEFAEDNNNSIDKENNSSISHHNNEQQQHFVNNCSVSHAINKPPLPHLSLNQKIQAPQLPAIATSKKDKNPSFQENENVHQSAHKPAGLIPEFQNKYHCNYLQNNGNSGNTNNNNNQQSSLLRQQQLPISQSSSLSITQSTSIKLFR